MSAERFDDAVEPIAVVGLGGRLPGARSVEGFWRNLCEGVESISRFTAEELIAAGVDPAQARDPEYVRASAVVEGADRFDAGFFGYTPREAETLDPQQRVFLEVAWEALEDAGHDPAAFRGAVGVFAGCFMNKYLSANLHTNEAFLRSPAAFFARIFNDKDFLATRVAYLLNLRGPAMTIQTACSTSLVATHLACQSLLSYDCDMALVGGVSINLPLLSGYPVVDGGLFAPEGRCRPFDARAQGTVPGYGAGIAVLRRLSDALADRDHVRAVIRGTAVNNDGSLKVGFTAPSVDAQAEVIAAAQAIAGVEPDTIGYLEAHGTATPVGDPIEVAALTQAFRARSTRRGFCALGSVKANIGHLDAAAGVAGLMRAVLALEHRRIPPSINFEAPNPRLELETTPFYVPTTLREWPRGEAPRRAGVSSFGVGGTNAHAVLEEAPAPEPSGSARPWQLLLLSARTRTALDAASARLADHLEAHPELSPAEVAFTLQAGRRAFEVRRFAVCRGAEEAMEALRAGDSRRLPTSTTVAGRRQVVFTFPGGGTQHPDMGVELYRSEEVFRREVDRASELLRPRLGLDLRRFLYPSLEGGAEVDPEHVPAVLSAIFVTEYALAKLWMSWGVKPHAMIGHSLGEYAAACLAGVFSLEDALDLTVARGELFARMPEGRMAAVQLSEREVRPLLGERLSLAAVNAPGLTLVSGPEAEIEALAARLAEREVECRRVHIRVASHSWMVEPYLEEFTRTVARYRLRPPEIPFVSGVTGTWIRPEEATDPAYWARHLRRPVRFAEGVREAVSEPGRILLEVGPGNALTTLASAQRLVPAPVAIASMRHPREEQSDLAFLLGAAGRLWQAGATLDWEAFHGEARPRRVPLPTYPFERRRFWVEAGRTVGAGGSAASAPVRIASWKRTLPPAPPAPGEGVLLLLDDGSGLGERIAARAAALGRTVARARLGDDVESLLRELAAAGKAPACAVLLRGAGTGGVGLELLPALARGAARVLVVADGVAAVTGEKAPEPARAALAGACVAASGRGAESRCVDVLREEAEGAAAERLAGRIVAEAELAGGAPLVALRGRERWERAYEPAPLPEGEPSPEALPPDGTYLFTGGVHGWSAALAEALAAEGARVVALDPAAEEAAESTAARVGEVRGIFVGWAPERAAREVELASHLAEACHADFCVLDLDPAAFAGNGVGAEEAAAAHFLAACAERGGAGGTAWLGIGWEGEGADRLPGEEGLRLLRHLLSRGVGGHLLVRAGAPERADLPPAEEAPAAEAGGDTPRTERERILVELWRELLGIERIGVEDDFFELGGHSLMIAQMTKRLRGLFSAKVSVRDLFEAPTVASLAALIEAREGAGGGAPAGPDLAAEPALDPEIRADGLPLRAPAAPRAVLLTGATGYLGAFLCAELLRRTGAEVHCLVRAGSVAEGEARVRAKLESFGLLSPEADRIVAVPGDLSKPLLGLSPSAFQALAERVDAVYHCGAWVNFARPYRALKETNVLGTQEVLRLAARARLKPVHHVSTLAVLAGALVAGAEEVVEDGELPPPVGHDTGYSQSKWVAEKVVEIARSRGIPVSVYRPGVVLGDSRTGVSNSDDYITKIIEGCVQLGLAPLRDYPLAVGTADYVAAAIVALSLQGDGVGRSFHTIDPEPFPWNRLFDHIRAFGYPVRSVPYDEWRRELEARVEGPEDNALEPLLGLLADTGDRRTPRFDCSNLLEGVARAGVERPTVDADFFAAVLRYFVRSGSLPPVPAEGERVVAGVARSGPGLA